MELATPHHPDRARRLTRPARLIGAHLQLGGKIEKSSLWPRWSSLPAVRRDDSCLERNRAPRGPQRMLTMRRGMNTLALQVQEALKRDPHGGDLYVFRGKNGKLIKILWHDGLGMSLYAKRLERGRFVWRQASDGAVTITPAQLGYLLEGIDWRHPLHSWRPSAAG